MQRLGPIGPRVAGDRRRVLLVANARSRRGRDAASAARARLAGRGLRVVERAVDGPGAVGAAIARHRREVDVVALAGGDGTLNAAVEALLDSGLPLAVLPVGTANDLARTLGIPSALAAACDVVADGDPRRIDLGWVNGKHFFNAASLGLSVAVSRRLTRERKRRWGALGYGLALLDELRASRAPAFRAEIRCGDRHARLRAIQITVGNGPRFGGGTTIWHDARIDDAMLDVVAIGAVSVSRLVLLAPLLRAGRHDRLRSVLHERGPEIRVETERPMAVNTDGELTARTPATFRVVPRSLAVLVPRPAADAPAAEERG